jgi:hypothetical protein
MYVWHWVLLLDKRENDRLGRSYILSRSLWVMINVLQPAEPADWILGIKVLKRYISQEHHKL